MLSVGLFRKLLQIAPWWRSKAKWKDMDVFLNLRTAVGSEATTNICNMCGNDTAGWKSQPRGISLWHFEGNPLDVGIGNPLDVWIGNFYNYGHAGAELQSTSTMSPLFGTSTNCKRRKSQVQFVLRIIRRTEQNRSARWWHIFTW